MIKSLPRKMVSFLILINIPCLCGGLAEVLVSSRCFLH